TATGTGAARRWTSISPAASRRRCCWPGWTTPAAARSRAEPGAMSEPAPGADRVVSPEPLTLSRLKAVSVRGGVASVLAMVVTQLFRLVVIAALGRLLSPSDFGIFAMTMGVLQVGTVFRDAGLSSATIQREDLTNAQVNTLFWVNLAFGAAATLIACACGPLVAMFFDDPRLVDVTRVLSLSFVLGALAAQHGALLTRHLKF